MSVPRQLKPPDTTVVSLFAAELASVLATMTGERPEWEASDARPAPISGRYIGWEQSFNDPSIGPAFLWTPHDAAVEIGNRMPRAAGITDEGESAAADTYLEIVRQALSSLARTLSARVGKEVSCADGMDRDTPPGGDHVPLRLKFPGGGTADCYVYFPSRPSEDKAVAVVAAPASDEGVTSTLEKSKTLDLLLDVELPVSVSFGRTRMALKDVVKLTTGCIIELERHVGQPVDIIVNDHVIARGEVVVVEGNFGVRIQQVASRQDRIRTVT